MVETEEGRQRNLRYLLLVNNPASAGSTEKENDGSGARALK